MVKNECFWGFYFTTTQVRVNLRLSCDTKLIRRHQAYGLTFFRLLRAHFRSCENYKKPRVRENCLILALYFNTNF